MIAASLLLLLGEHIAEIRLVVVDEEYSGNEADIKGILLHYINAVAPGFDKHRISFRRIGKSSGAHAKAYQVYRGEQKADRTIAAEEIMAVLDQ